MPRGPPTTSDDQYDRLTGTGTDSRAPLDDDDSHTSDPLAGSSPLNISRSSSRQPSRTQSPYLSSSGPALQQPLPKTRAASSQRLGDIELSSLRKQKEEAEETSDDAWREVDGDDPLAAADAEGHHLLQDDDQNGMPSDLRPQLGRPTDGRSYTPLLNSKQEHQYGEPDRLSSSHRRSTRFRERDPEVVAKNANRKRYTTAGIFLIISLISFTVQTETAVYIQHNLGWKKAYAMLYFTHGSWFMLWFLQLGIMRVQKWSTPWSTFWRQHKQLLRSTAQMVQHQDQNAPSKYPNQSPIPYMIRTTAFITCALTVAGGSWYVAVDQTTASDLTAIYNCSAFFAYAFSVPLLHERLRIGKVAAVLIACAGVFVVAYGDSGSTPKHGSKSGGGTHKPADGEDEEAQNRALGNIVIGIGSVLYGFYEVLYKRYACPPDGTSPGRSTIFANTFGSLIGTFTLTVLWIPLPILNWLGWEIWEWPTGEQAWMLLISVFANAIFSGSFLVLISLTSPVLSSVAALLTIFLVALTDQLLPPPLYNPLSQGAVIGGLLIIFAFAMLSWASYREMEEEKQAKAKDAAMLSDEEDEEDEENGLVGHSRRIS